MAGQERLNRFTQRGHRYGTINAMSISCPDTVFIRFVALGHGRTFLFAHALRRYLARLGIDPSIVTYKPAASVGLLNEVSVSARLDVESWRAISAWCEKRFRSLRVHQVINGQLDRFLQYGASGEEPYERAVA